MANHDAPAVSQKVERYFNLLILFIYGQSIVSNDVNRWQTDFWPPNHWRIIFPTMSPLFSQMSPLFLEPWDIVPSYEISRQNTASDTQVSDPGPSWPSCFVVVTWLKWLPCPYMVKTLKKSSTSEPLGWMPWKLAVLQLGCFRRAPRPARKYWRPAPFYPALP